MKKFLFAIMAIAALFSFAACNDTETYKDLRDASWTLSVLSCAMKT